MRINGHSNSGIELTENSRLSQSQKSGQSNSPQASDVNFSEGRVALSSSLQKLSQATSAYDIQRAARVQGLAAQYQSGQYRSDATATSQAMLEQAFLSRN